MLYEALKPFLFALDAERAHEEVAGLMALLAPVPGEPQGGAEQP